MGAEGTRVRFPHRRAHSRGERAPVGADVGEREREGPGQVRFRVAEGDLETLAFLFDQQVEQRFFRRGVARRPEVHNGEAVHFAPEGTHEGPFPSRAFAFPVAEFGEQPLAVGFVGQPRQHPFGAALLRPLRQQRAQIGPAGDVGIDIPGHFDPEGARLGDDFGVFGDAVPGSGVQVVDLQTGARVPGDGDAFTESFDPAPQVAHIEPAVRRRDPRQGGQLLGAGERVRDVREAARQREGALFHRFGDEALHLAQLLVGRFAFLVADHGGAHLSRTHIGHHIEADPGGFQSVEIAAERRPVALDRRRHHHRVVHRRPEYRARRQVLPQHFGGHPLRHLAERPRVHHQPVLRVGVHVDEARRERHPPGLDDLRGGRRLRPDRGDRVPGDRHIGPIPGTAGPVHHPRADDQQVGLIRGIGGRPAAAGEEEDQGQEPPGPPGAVSSHRHRSLLPGPPARGIPEIGIRGGRPLPAKGYPTRRT